MSQDFDYELADSLKILWILLRYLFYHLILSI